METLGMQIKKIRKERGMTQKDLAGDVIARSLLSLIENGNTAPSIETLKYIADKLDTPISYFLMDSPYFQDELDRIIADLENKFENNEYDSMIKICTDFLMKIAKNIKSYNQNSIGKLYANLGMAYLKTNHDQALYYLEKAARKISPNESDYLSKCYNNLGVLMWKNKNFEQMRRYLTYANNLLANVHIENIQLKLDILYNLALSHYQLTNFNEVVKLINDSLDYSKQYDLYYNFGHFCMLITLAHKNNNDIELALKYNNKAIDYYNLTENDYMKYRCYTNHATLLRISKDYARSLLFNDESINYFKSINDNDKLVNAKTEKLKLLFFAHEEYTIVRNLANELLEMVGDRTECHGEVLSILGGLAAVNKDYDTALEILLKAEKILCVYKNNELLRFVYLGLNKIYAKKRMFESAYKYLSLASTINKEIDFYFT